jgi:predicted transcriptional regulator of viral defense system
MPGEIGKVRRFLSSRPVFTRGQFREIVGAGQSASTADTLLAHHAKAQHIVHAAPGVYAAVPPHLSPETFTPDALLVASMIRDDGILAYHTALGLHGLAYSEGGETFVLSCGKPWQVDTISGPVRFVTQPAALRRAQMELDGVETMDRRGLDVRVTDVARTIVDCLERPDLAGGAEEVGHALGSVEFIDVEAVLTTTFARGNRTLAALVGWWLEKRREDFLVEDETLDRLRQVVPPATRAVMGADPESGVRTGDWNLIVPSELAGPAFEDLDPGMRP